MALTAQEEKELAELEQEFGSQGSLTPEESIELQSLEKEFAPNAALAPETPIANGAATENMNPFQVASAMASKLTFGVTPIAAGVEAVAGHLLNGGSLAESHSIFDQGRDEWNKAVAAVDKDYPTVAVGLDAADFALRMMPAGRAANLALSTIEQVGANGLNKESLAKGTAYALGGEALGKGIGKAAKYVNQWGEAVEIGAAFEKIGVKTREGFEGLYNILLNKKVDPKRFVEKVSEYSVDGMQVFTGTAKEIAEKANTKIDQLGTELGDFYADISNSIPPMPASDLLSEISDTIKMLGNTIDTKELETVGILKNKLVQFQGKGMVSLSDIHELKQAVNRGIKWADHTAGDFNSRLEKLSGIINTYSKDIITRAPVSPEVKGMVRAASDEFSNLSIVRGITSGDVAKDAAKLYHGKQLAKDITSFLYNKAAGLGGVLSSALLDTTQKAALAKILSAQANNVEKMTPYIAKIIEGVSRDPNVLNKMLASAESALDLYLNPVERNSQSVEKNSDHIYNTLKEKDPAVASKFIDAMNNERFDVVGELLSSMSNLPEFKDFIEPGIGWDGKVTNEVEKAIVKKQIMETDLSVIQQMQQIKALDKAGIIPQAAPKMELRQLAKKPIRTADGKKMEKY